MVVCVEQASHVQVLFSESRAGKRVVPVCFVLSLDRLWWREKRGAGSIGVGVRPACSESSFSGLGLALSYVS